MTFPNSGDGSTSERVIDGLVFSWFDDKIGPDVVATIPATMSRKVARSAAEKSLGLIAGSERSVPKDIEIVSLPGTSTKIMVKCLQLEDATARSGRVSAALAVLFNEVHDVVFYKYFTEFNALLEDVARKFQGSRDVQAITETLEHVSARINDHVDELRDAEMLGPATPFPDVPAVPAAGRDDAGAGRAYRCKIIVCGDPRVGKTSTILRFTDNAFRRTYLMTVGVNLSVKAIKLAGGATVEFTIWDVAGQAKFQVMRKRYYENARGFFLVFDKTRRETLDNLIAWYKDIRQHLGPGIPGMILANKADLDARVSPADIDAVAGATGLQVLDTSARDGTNVARAFEELGRSIVKAG